MEKDIVPELLSTIEKAFNEKTLNSDMVKKAIKALSDKNATYKDANLFAIEIGEILSDVLKTHIRLDILPDGKMHFNIADRILNATIKKNYELITGYTADVQTELNHIAELSIKGQVPKINQHKIDGIIERLSTEEFEKIKWLLDEPIKNLSQSMVDDTARANMAFQHKSGLSPKITRVVVGNCCDWCREIAGTYNYKDSPPNIYQRHRYCRCMVVYDPRDGKKKTVYTRKWEDPEKKEKIEARKKIGIKKS